MCPASHSRPASPAAAQRRRSRSPPAQRKQCPTFRAEPYEVTEPFPPLPATGCLVGRYPAWQPPVYSPASVTVPAGATATITVANTLACERGGYMTKRGNTCVERERQPRVTPSDVIRIIPSFGGGGRGGQDGRGRAQGGQKGSSSPGVHRCALPLSVVAVDALAPLVPFLRLDRQGRDRPRLEPAQRDRFARLLAVAVGAVVDPRQRLVDLGDQLALSVTGAQLNCTVRFRRRTVGEIRVVLILFLEMQKRLLRLFEN